MSPLLLRALFEVLVFFGMFVWYVSEEGRTQSILFIGR